MPKRSKKKAKSRPSKSANSFELKPSSYQPSKKELEADISVPVSFDRLVDAVFASDRQQTASP
jgi:hypothetical protein